MKHSKTTTMDAENGVLWQRPFPWTLLLQSNHINLTINQSLSYLWPSWMRISKWILFYRIFTMLLTISDSWQRLLLQALFLQLNYIDITSRLILEYFRPIWMEANGLSLIQRKNGTSILGNCWSPVVSSWQLWEGSGIDKMTNLTWLSRQKPATCYHRNAQSPQQCKYVLVSAL
jgi:hypothetical protein